MNLVEVVSQLAVARAGTGKPFLARVPNRMDTTATGPMAVSLDTPNTAYNSGGTKLLSAKKKLFRNPHVVYVCMYVFVVVVVVKE